MANLFGRNKLKELALRLKTTDLKDEIEIVRDWHQDYHEGTLRQDKETSREQAYNQDFFIKILGYKEKPHSPYSFEPKATTEAGDFPDAILGYTDKSKRINNISAVVELKGATIDLDRPQRRAGNMSPVQQGFKYKIQYRDCPFVIVSNFWEFRLYHDNQLDYEKWTLDDLVNPANDYLQFKTFYTLIHNDNLITSKGSSRTENLLSDIRLEQEEIGRKFYQVYRQARLNLLRDIYSQNGGIRSNIDSGVEKAQKIIDRIVFACFAEDRGLLPDDTVHRVVLASDHSAFGGSLWATFKAFFEAIDVGSEKLGIPDGYNGGLFAHDPKLNALKIGDEALRSVAELGKYNFDEDLSVNILGHIFEQSISDLEEIKNKVNKSQDLKELQQSRRKKDGIFYTPDYIVRYIVDNSLGTYLREHEEKAKEEFSLKENIEDKTYEKREKKAYIKYQGFLQNIKVVDPACGSGAFLVYAFDYLLAENKRVYDILGTSLFNNEQYIRDILQNNIYGVDLNEESVEITKLSLWLKTAQKGKRLTALDANIKCGNSLIDDSAVVGNKAFNWRENFVDIFSNGGFDIVIGNPPYVRQELIRSQVSHLSEKYESHSGKADLFVYFFEHAVKILKGNGIFGYISSSKFLEANYGRALINYLINNTNFRKVINFGDLEVFEGVTAYPIVFIAQKTRQQGDFIYAKIDNLNFSSLESVVTMLGSPHNMTDFRQNDFKFHNKEITRLLAKLKKGSVSFSELYPLPTVGIKTGFNEAYLHNTDKPYVFGRDIKKYQSIIPSNSIIFPYKWDDEKGYTLLPERDLEHIEHLKIYKGKLSQRAVIKDGIQNGQKQWYEYQQINRKLNFESEYIVYPNVSLGSNFTLSKGKIVDMTGFIIPTNSKFLLALLNSKLFAYFMNLTAISRRGGYNEFKVQYIAKFPIKLDPDSESIDRIERLAHESIALQNKKRLLAGNFINLVSNEYQFEISMTKLNNWWQCSFKDFLESLKIKLNLSQKDDLLSLFDKYQPRLIDLQTKLNQTEAEIDQVIYQLYDLTREEVRVVEEGG